MNADTMLRHMARIVDAARDVEMADRLGNVHEADWMRRLRASFDKVPDEERQAFNENMAALLRGERPRAMKDYSDAVIERRRQASPSGRND